MSYAQDAANVSGKPSSVHSSLCGANGCPLSGALTTSTNGGDRWLCRVHFGAAYAEYDGVTTRINNRASLYQIAVELSNYGSGQTADLGIRARIKALGRADFLKPAEPGRSFTARGLAAFMFSVLDAECRTPQAHMGVPAQDGATSWIDDSELTT